MADSANVELRIRNAELEVELRMVKEQLAQAHQSTQYLLQLASRSSSSLGAGHVDDRAPQLQIEASKRASRKDSVLGTVSTAGTFGTSSQRAAEAQLVNLDAEIPLLDDGAGEALAETPSLVPVGNTASHERAQDCIGLGILNNDSTRPNSSSEDSHQAQAGFTIRNSDGTTSFIRTPTITPESSFCSTPAPPPIPMSGNEHRSLAGKACFWVDMEPQELTKALAWYAEGRRRTAEEYRTYFEDVIRPEYEARMGRLQVTRGGLLAGSSDQQTEEQEHGQTLSKRDVEEEPATKVDHSTAPGGEGAYNEAQASEYFEVKETARNIPESIRGSDDAEQLLDDDQISTTIEVHMPNPNQEPKSSLQESWNDFEARGMTSGFEENDPAKVRQIEEVPTAKPETMVADYVPPRLHKPNALEDAKSLQAEFLASGSNRGRGRGQRTGRHSDPTERPGLTAADVSHATPAFIEPCRSRHAVPEGPRVATDNSAAAEGSYRQDCHNSSFITYPMEVEELFATPAEGDRNPHRTVLISNLPADMMLIDVLDHVKGGKIYSALLIETAGMRTTPEISTNSALITFVFGREARSVADHWSGTAWLLPSISRPIPGRVVADVIHDNLSRVMFVFDAEKNLPGPKEVAQQIMRSGAQHPLKSEYDEEVPGLMLFHYASMAEAQTALRAVNRDRSFFGEVTRGFYPDPCGVPVMKDEVQVEVEVEPEAEEDQDEEGAGEVQGGRVDLNKIEDWDQKYVTGIHSKIDSERFEG